MEPKQILSKVRLYRKQKKRKLKKSEKTNVKSWRDKKNVRLQDESDTGDKNIVKRVV